MLSLTVYLIIGAILFVGLGRFERILMSLSLSRVLDISYSLASSFEFYLSTESIVTRLNVLV